MERSERARERARDEGEGKREREEKKKGKRRERSAARASLSRALLWSSAPTAGAGGASAKIDRRAWRLELTRGDQPNERRGRGFIPALCSPPPFCPRRPSFSGLRHWRKEEKTRRRVITMRSNFPSESIPRWPLARGCLSMGEIVHR